MNERVERKNIEEFKKKLHPTIGSIHNHTKRSLYDSGNEFTDMANYWKSVGGSVLAITDHGVMTGIEDAKEIFKNADIKLIPGVEAYVEEDDSITGKREHLILLAKDDIGYHAIAKAVTESNTRIKGSGNTAAPCMNKEILNKWFGPKSKGHKHVFATSACVGGVISSILLQNEGIKNKIEKLNKQLEVEGDRTIGFPLTEAAEKEFLKTETKINSLISDRDQIKKIAERKFNSVEKAIKKKEGEEKEEALKTLEAQKKATEEAKEKLEDIKEALKDARKSLGAARKEIETAKDKDEKRNSIVKKLLNYENHLLTEEELKKKAVEETKIYNKIFGSQHFLMEVQYHGIPNEKVAMTKIAEIANELKLPLIAANDAHMVRGTDEERLQRKLLRSIRFGTAEEEIIGDSELYLKTNEELFDALVQILSPEDCVRAINNITVLCNQCNVEFKHENHYPKFPSIDGKTAEEMLKDKVEEGIVWRFPNGLPENYKERLNYELQIINSMGYADYHLVVQDFLAYGRLLGYVPEEQLKDSPLTIEELKKWIEENNWKNGTLTIGPGRGSAVGSLVCYLLGITNLDPIKHDLLFERFLNPERVSMPDIDSDLAYNVRERVVDYVTEKYGHNAVCGILTTNKLAPKGAVRMAARFYGLYKDGKERTEYGNIMSKWVPSKPKIAFDSPYNEDEPAGISVKEHIAEEIEKLEPKAITNEMNEQRKAEMREILQWASYVEGRSTAYGTHAAGIVISDNHDISDYIPLYWNSTKEQWSTQCNMIQVEENGLLKFDFLGLRTLNIISDALIQIEKTTGKILNPLEWDVNDKVVYDKIFKTGNTDSVFQFESGGMKEMLKQFGPDNFDDIVLLVAAYRPGPMQFLSDIIDIKKGRKKISYLCPELEPIVKNTYGAIIYQEQVMQICQDLAGFTLGQADIVRRYMSKKKADKLEHERIAFIYGDKERNIDGCVKRGISEAVATKLFDQMMDFASYAFNKSHAAAYAFNSFLTAYLKAYYPVEFFTAALNWTTIPKLPKLMREIKKFDIQVLPPSINDSDIKFKITDGKIRFGLTMIKGIGEKAKAIVEERKNGRYISISDFCLRVNIGSNAIDMAKAGAFDEFCSNRAGIICALSYIPELQNKLKTKQKNIEKYQTLKEIAITVKDSNDYQAKQKEVLGKVIEKTWHDGSVYDSKIDNAKSDIEEIKEELYLVQPSETVAEDKIKRCNEEKEFIGLYVTQHPFDFYPESKKLNQISLDQVNEKTNSIYGVVTNVEIKLRKKDGKPMAFFTLEDDKGEVNVSCFTAAYKNAAEYIENGKAVIITGHVDDINVDEDENQQITFIAKTVKPIATKNEEKLLILQRELTYEQFKNDILPEIRKYKADEMEESYELEAVIKNNDSIKFVPFAWKVKKEIKIRNDVFSVNEI